MGKGSGIDSVNIWLQQLGMQVSEEDALKIMAAVKAYSLKNKKMLTRGEFAIWRKAWSIAPQPKLAAHC